MRTVLLFLIFFSLCSSEEKVCDVKKERQIGMLRPEHLPSERVFQEWENKTIQLPGKEVRSRSLYTCQKHNTCYDLELIK